MGLFNRIVQVCMADLHGMMDQIEDPGLMLKQYLREMKTSLEKKEYDIKKLESSKTKIKNALTRNREEIDKLETDLNLALKMDKEDICRLLLRKIKSLHNQSKTMDDQLLDHDNQIKSVSDCLVLQRLEYERITIEADIYFSSIATNKTDDESWPISSQDSSYLEISDEEIELELLKRKQSLTEEVAK